MDDHTRAMIEHKIELVEAAGFGEVNIKIKNGAVYRVINSVDTLVDQNCSEKLDKDGKK